MKKINLVLCAVAIACTAFFASCNNGATTYTDVTYEDFSNTYDLVSLTTVTVVAETETNAAGTAVSHDTVTTTDVFTADTETKAGKNVATISWSVDEREEGFTSYKLKINGNIAGKAKTKTNDGEFSAEVTTNTNSEGITDYYWDGNNYILGKEWSFYKQDGKYYIKGDSGNYNLVTGDLESDTTISFTDVEVVDMAGPKLKDAKNKDIVTTTTTYTIVLKASESL